MGLVQRTVYFREEDIPKWEEVRNKAEWLHNSLNIRESYIAMSRPERKAVKEHLRAMPEIIKTPKQAEKVIKDVTKEKSIPLCKTHGVPLTDYGKCLQKGCKYGK